MISFYNVRVGYPEVRTVYHILNKVVVWQRKHKTEVPPTKNLPSHRLV